MPAGRMAGVTGQRHGAPPPLTLLTWMRATRVGAGGSRRPVTVSAAAAACTTITGIVRGAASIAAGVGPDVSSPSCDEPLWADGSACGEVSSNCCTRAASAQSRAACAAAPVGSATPAYRALMASHAWRGGGSAAVLPPPASGGQDTGSRRAAAKTRLSGVAAVKLRTPAPAESSVALASASAAAAVLMGAKPAGGADDTPGSGSGGGASDAATRASIRRGSAAWTQPGRDAGTCRSPSASTGGGERSKPTTNCRYAHAAGPADAQSLRQPCSAAPAAAGAAVGTRANAKTLSGRSPNASTSSAK